MRLRSGSLTKEYNRPPTRRHTPRMSNTSSNVDEIPSRTLGTSDPVITQVAPFPPLNNTNVSGSTASVSVPISQTTLVSPGPVVAMNAILNTMIPRYGTADPSYKMP